MRGLTRLERIIRTVGWVLLAVALSSMPVLARSTCYRATVQADVVLPDGSVHPRGELQICRQSQASDLHLVRVGGHSVGLFTGRDGGEVDGGGSSMGAVFVFVRNENSELELQGYAERRVDRFRVFHLTSATGWADALGTGVVEGEWVAQVAVRR